MIIMRGAFTLFTYMSEYSFHEQRFFELRKSRGQVMAQSPILKDRSQTNQEPGTDSAAMNRVGTSHRLPPPTPS